jgi:hypothetical protein
MQVVQSFLDRLEVVLQGWMEQIDFIVVEELSVSSVLPLEIDLGAFKPISRPIAVKHVH